MSTVACYMTTREWTMNQPLSEVVVGDIVDTGERIVRVTGLQVTDDLVTLHLREGTPYAAAPDNLIDIFR
jgi:hypothetical protein